MSDRLEPIGDVLARLGIAPAIDWSPEELVGMAPTEQVAHALAELQAKHDGLEADHPQRAILGAAIRRGTLALEKCRRRDELQAARPAGCWCLGAGGCQPVAVGLDDGALLDEQGEPVFGFREYCGCPEGALLKGEIARLRVLDEARRRRERVQRLWDSTGIPDCFRELNLETLRARVPAYSGTLATLQKEWLPGTAWLVLHGRHGRGKTGLAVGLCKELLRRRYHVLFRNLPSLLTTLRGAIGDHERTAELERTLGEVDVLVLDDVGAGGRTDPRTGQLRPTDWADEVLFRLIEERHGNRRRTLLTSNLAPRDLAAYLTERVWERIRERAENRWVVLLDARDSLRDPEIAPTNGVLL